MASVASLHRQWLLVQSRFHSTYLILKMCHKSTKSRLVATLVPSITHRRPLLTPVCLKTELVFLSQAVFRPSEALSHSLKPFRMAVMEPFLSPLDYRMSTVPCNNLRPMLLSSRCLKAMLFTNSHKLTVHTNSPKLTVLTNSLKFMDLTSNLKPTVPSNSLKLTVLTNSLKRMVPSNSLRRMVPSNSLKPLLHQ